MHRMKLTSRISTRTRRQWRKQRRNSILVLTFLPIGADVRFCEDEETVKSATLYECVTWKWNWPWQPEAFNSFSTVTLVWQLLLRRFLRFESDSPPIWLHRAASLSVCLPFCWRNRRKRYAKLCEMTRWNMKKQESWYLEAERAPKPAGPHLSFIGRETVEQRRNSVILH